MPAHGASSIPSAMMSMLYLRPSIVAWLENSMHLRRAVRFAGVRTFRVIWPSTACANGVVILERATTHRLQQSAHSPSVVSFQVPVRNPSFFPPRVPSSGHPLRFPRPPSSRSRYIGGRSLSGRLGRSVLDSGERCGWRLGREV